MYSESELARCRTAIAGCLPCGGAARTLGRTMSELRTTRRITPPSAGSAGTAANASRGRVRNRRGEGGRLREEIVAAATRILEETMSPAAVTLRAVARDVGIATTSIYGHFADREAIFSAIADQGYMDLAATTSGARDSKVRPVEQLLAGCRAYLEFARLRPHIYSVLFTSSATPGAPAGARTPSDSMVTREDDPGAASFQVLVDGVACCAREGVSASTDHFADAVAVWVALHGYATLHIGQPYFPWPPDDDTVEHLVLRLARVDSS
jgi:AcrR family transcriptional regulator